MAAVVPEQVVGPASASSGPVDIFPPQKAKSGQDVINVQSSLGNPPTRFHDGWLKALGMADHQAALLLARQAGQGIDFHQAGRKWDLNEGVLSRLECLCRLSGVKIGW